MRKFRFRLLVGALRHPMRRLSPVTTVIACIALFVALTGTATAGAVALITGKQIKNGTIGLVDLSAKTKSALKGNRGTAGRAGLPGPAGPQGSHGAKGDPGSKGDKGDKGDSTLLRLSGEFEGTNASVATSLDGVQFGPYPDGGAWGGSVCYSGANDLELGDITQLHYFAMYSTANDTTVGVPYLRIFLAGGHDVIFSPNTQPTPDVEEDVFHVWNVVTGTVRYDDDPGNGPDSPWAVVRAAHATEDIESICVSAGFSAGVPLAAILRTLGVNGEEFTFGAK
jgi:Collagen triple helix repeat (20 copies)